MADVTEFEERKEELRWRPRVRGRKSEVFSPSVDHMESPGQVIQNPVLSHSLTEALDLVALWDCPLALDRGAIAMVSFDRVHVPLHGLGPHVAIVGHSPLESDTIQRLAER